MSVLNAKGEDLDHLAIVRMVVDWLHSSHKVMKLAKKKAVAPSHAEVQALADGTMPKEQASQILRRLLLDSAIREAIAQYLHSSRAHLMPMATLRKELKEMAAYVKPMAKAADAGLVLPK